MTRYVIAILLFCSVIRSSGQSFSTDEWNVLSLRIVNMIAENKMLIRNAKSDSASIAAMEQGRIALENEINQCKTAYSKEHELSSSQLELLQIAGQTVKELKSEIRKQKFLKW